MWHESKEARHVTTQSGRCLGVEGKYFKNPKWHCHFEI
jgi:hypothetical protein